MVSVTEYKGALLGHVYFGSAISVTCAVDKTGKLHYRGNLCVDHLTNSYLYGEEAHIIVYQKEKPKFIPSDDKDALPKVEENMVRVAVDNDGEPEYLFRESKSRDWHRVEFHLPPGEMDNLALKWLLYRGYKLTKED